MRHLFLFINALIIPVVAVALVMIAILRRSRRLDGFYRDVEIFLIALLVASVTNLPLYYDYEIFNLNLSRLAYSFGWEMICSVYVFFWVHAVSGLLKDNLRRFLRKFNLIVATSYTTGWILSAFLMPDTYEKVMNVFEFIKQVPNAICLVLCIMALKDKGCRKELRYCALGSLLFLIEYIVIYLIEPTSVMSENLYVAVWVLISLLTILMVTQAAKQPEITAESTQRSEAEVLSEIKAAHQLTDRETVIYSMILGGKTNQQISEELFIGEATVKTHIHNLFKKLGTASRIDAILLVKERMNDSSKDN